MPRKEEIVGELFNALSRQDLTAAKRHLAPDVAITPSAQTQLPAIPGHDELERLAADFYERYQLVRVRALSTESCGENLLAEVLLVARGHRGAELASQGWSAVRFEGETITEITGYGGRGDMARREAKRVS